jgi:hypothetical protein
MMPMTRNLQNLVANSSPSWYPHHQESFKAFRSATFAAGNWPLHVTLDEVQLLDEWITWEYIMRKGLESGQYFMLIGEVEETSISTCMGCDKQGYGHSPVVFWSSHQVPNEFPTCSSCF